MNTNDIGLADDLARKILGEMNNCLHRDQIPSEQLLSKIVELDRIIRNNQKDIPGSTVAVLIDISNLCRNIFTAKRVVLYNVAVMIIVIISQVYPNMSYLDKFKYSSNQKFFSDFSRSPENVNSADMIVRSQMYTLFGVINRDIFQS